ncbi:TonB-dependent receptor domain-containing protein [Pseudoduganella violacea]|uniref:Iron complex outermembrane receptor protein n=1 Tax=Pseudoduganella violacea TaxID=1715466 RepID=A0A7W5BDA5_9BURK|nr:TonB-dependent receptor [Pseudoduganella violacea]MBB3121052.1 iron complex outermembrane receptor protein [Pseudoduganella violacea]
MMMKEKVLARSLRLICWGGVALGLGAGTPAALAQSADGGDKMTRVEITGSSIRRIAKEGTLPVQTLTQEDIKKTGASSATELIQNLPAMQGFVPASSSVNGGGSGATTAALHSLQSKYTLVLLDGQRMAPVELNNTQGGGYAVNIESIPLEAVERVEILTDGASALYGSDAISGVVNFILKKNKTDGNAYVTTHKPQHKGGSSWSAGITKGFGDLDRDRFNILFSYSHEKQQALAASQREASRRGTYLPFSYKGKNYVYDAATENTEPANITINARPANAPAGTAPTAYSINPYYNKNGNCGSSMANAQIDPLGYNGVSCRFNYAAMVQTIPESQRDSGLLKGSFQLNDSTTLWAEAVLSRFKMRSQYGSAAQPMGINATTRFPVLWNKYVQPFLTANNLVPADADPDNPNGPLGTLGYRSVLVGGRADDYITDARHLSFGVTGQAMGWSYNASAVLSRSQLKDKAAGGYTDFDKLVSLVASGKYDLIMGTGAELLRDALVNGTEFQKSVSTLNSLHFGAQHDVLELPGGMAIGSVGGDFVKTRYRTDYHPLILSQSGFEGQPASANYPVGGSYGQVPFDAERQNWGILGEALLPLHKTVEANVSARYDKYDRVHSRHIFTSLPDPATGLQMRLPAADLGNTFNSSTYKVSLRWTPVENVLLRAAYGTGFKAPNLNEVAGALTFNGSTSGNYSCPFPGTSGCRGGLAQYDLLKGPNSASGDLGLRPEKSKQWTLGGRIEPLSGLSLGMDVWNVQIRNQILSGGIPEAEGFRNAEQYKHLFVNPYTDPGGGFTTIGYKQLPVNGGVANYRGLDWDFSYRNRKTGLGKLSATWTGTRMLRQNYTMAPNGEVKTDLGVFGPDNAVVFKWQSHLTLSLDSGPFNNTLSAHYKSGYKDQSYAKGTAIFPVLANGQVGTEAVEFEGLDTPSYTTFDWQGKWTHSKAWSVTAGVKNLFDRKPPLSLQSAGGGNQGGYDGRYADPLGRTFYLTAGYNF